MLTASVCCAGGCETPPPAQTSPSSQTRIPRIDGQIVHTRSFSESYLLADFERPEHAQGFSSDSPNPLRIIAAGPSDRNAHALEASLAPQGMLTLDLEADEIERPTDWRNISTLGFQLLAPALSGPVRVTLHTGPQSQLAWSQTVILTTGWNACALSLTSIAERIDLADVRRVTWQWLGSDATQLVLDQLELREDITIYDLGDSALEFDPLVLMQRGSQIHVGVAGSFELVFDRGLIVGWYDRQRLIGGQRRITESGSIDFNRLPPVNLNRPSINLSHFVGLGPHPTPLPENWPSAEQQPPSFDNPRLFATWGSSLMTRQTIVEATMQKVVIEAQWRFASSPSSNSPAGEHRWRYTIYPSGDVLVNVRSDGPIWPGERVGYAVTLTGRMGFEPVGVGQREGLPQAVLFERPLGPSDLLWVPYAADEGTTLQELSSPRDRWLAVLIASPTSDLPIERAHWLHFGSCGVQLARAWMTAYQTPAMLEITAGELIRDADGDLDHDGFNESSGVYELHPTASSLRLTLHTEPPPFGLHLRIHGSVAHRVQAYQDGRRIERLLRDHDGLAVLTLNPRAEPPSQVEIFVAQSP